MDNAISSCEVKPVLSCNTTDAQEYIATKNGIIQEYKNLRDTAKNIGMDVKLTNAIAKAREIIADSQARLDKAKIDVSVEKAKLNEISAMVDSAEQNKNSKNYDAAKNDLESAKAAFKELRESALSKRSAAAKTKST